MKVKGTTTYNRVIQIPEAQDGAFSIKHVTLKAGTKLPVTTFRTAVLGGHKGPAVVYDDQTTWHTLCEGKGQWMSDFPIEQAQIDQELKPIQSGRVLIGGLGLGYAATVLAKRPKITRVVVVEQSPEVIRLVAPYLLADDPVARAKVEVIQADLFDYLQTLGPRAFRWAYYDIWASDSERTFFKIVQPLFELSAGRIERTPINWNESVMRGQLLNSITYRLQFSLANAGPIPVPIENLADFTIERFSEPVGSIWIDWAVPFFQFVRARLKTEPGTPQDLLMDAAQTYVAQYGKPLFRSFWHTLTGITVPMPDLQALRNL